MGVVKSAISCIHWDKGTCEYHFKIKIADKGDISSDFRTNGVDHLEPTGQCNTILPHQQMFYLFIQIPSFVDVYRI